MISVRPSEKIQRTQSLRSAVMSTLDRLHLGNSARTAKTAAMRRVRRARRFVQAHMLWFWRPLVPADSFTTCCRNAIRAVRDQEEVGCYLEFGVSRGTSLACMYHALQSERMAQVRLIGFDSFEGLPPEAAKEGWVPGAFWSTRSATEKYLRQQGVDMRRVALVEGWFKETLTEETKARHGIESASLIMIDCDIHSASKDALWFCEPLIRDRAVIFFDDWGRRSDKGEIGQKEAFEEFLAAFPALRAEPLPAYIPAARVFVVSRIDTLDRAPIGHGEPM